MKLGIPLHSWVFHLHICKFIHQFVNQAEQIISILYTLTPSIYDVVISLEERGLKFDSSKKLQMEGCRGQKMVQNYRRLKSNGPLESDIESLMVLEMVKRSQYFRILIGVDADH